MAEWASTLRSALFGGRRAEAAPKDFWISDSACTSCYDCGSVFTLLTRRHHCRVCGRIFCAQCTSRSLPSATGGDSLRACSFCWQLRTAASASAAESEEADEAQAVARESSQEGAAALAHAWRGTSPQQPSAAPALEAEPSSSRLGEGVQALARAAVALPESDDSDEDLAAPAPSSEAAARARHDALAALLDEGGLGGAEGGVASVKSAASLSDDASADLLLLPFGEAEAHPLLARDDEDGEESADAAAAAASFASWTAALEARDAGEAAHEEGWVETAEQGGASVALLEALERGEASAWAAPPAATPTTLAAAAACRQALRDAAAHHLRCVLAQALCAAAVPHAQAWVPVLADLAAAAAAAVQPSAAGAGYSMDPRDYVCVKRVAGGARTDSRLVCGVACRRNVAHRRMATHVEAPRLLLLGGALQYQRVEGRLSSLDTLLEQERAHLRVACARALALRPHVLLVEKSCARYAQELLLAQGVALVLNVKPAVLRRLARATGASVAPGAEHLREAHLGSCGAFRVEALAEEHAGAGAAPGAVAGPGPRTLMVFDGCPRPLCATLLLCGAGPDELARVKALTPWAVYAAHHLRLEAALLADQLAAAGTQPDAAAAAVAEAVAAAAARLSLGWPQLLWSGLGAARLWKTSLSPHLRLSARPPPPPGGASSERATACWAAALLRSEERLLVSLSCRCPQRRALCEPHHVRAIDHYCGTDVPLGHFLAAALPGPGRHCGCGDGPEAHVRSYAAGRGRLTLRVRVGAQGGGGAPAEGVWHWSRCTACPMPAEPTPRLLLSEDALRLSLGKFLALSLAAPDLRAPCGHSLHACSLRFFATPLGTVCAAFAPQARMLTALPRRALLPERCASSATWLAGELEELGCALRAVSAELRAQLRSSWAEQGAGGGGDGREPPVLLGALEGALEGEWGSLGGRLRDVAAAPDAFAVNRLKRSLAGARRRWAAALAELQRSAWRSSFPVEAQRGWALQALHEGQPERAGGHARTPSGGAGGAAAPPLPGRALLPLGVGGAAVVVYDDEPTSVVAFALASHRYAQLLAAQVAQVRCCVPAAPAPVDTHALAALASAGVAWEVVASPVPAHVRVCFEERGGGGPDAPTARFAVSSFYAPQFEALRRLWGVSPAQLLRSLCRCARWESFGGKSGAYFAKTRDDALVVKALSRPELASLLEFAPAYAAYAAAAAAADRPVLLAKLVGVFSVTVAAPGRREVKLDLVVQENLFAGGGFAPVYDLKGAAGKSRLAPGDAPVLLDENLVERTALDAPLCVGHASGLRLAAAVWRDTAFLARLGVMDYSLLVGLRREGAAAGERMALGIVDYLRQYTWDKQLETVVKSSAVLALGPAQQPTVISPKEYARRFRKAMRAYFVIVPDVGGAAQQAEGDASKV